MTSCPVCGSKEVAVVLKRAWCLRLYAKGGCGSFFRFVRGAWRLIPLEAS